METEATATPHFCPICGDKSIETVSGSAALRLFRCGKGHFFTFEPKEGQDQKGPKKRTRLMGTRNEDSAVFRAARQRIESSKEMLAKTKEIVRESHEKTRAWKNHKTPEESRINNHNNGDPKP